MQHRQETGRQPPNLHDTMGGEHDCKLLQFPKLLLRVTTKSIEMANHEMLQFSENRQKGEYGAFGWETILATQGGERFWSQWSYALAHSLFKKIREQWHVTIEDIEDVYRVRQALTLIFGPLYSHHNNRMPVLSKKKLVVNMREMAKIERDFYEREVFGFMLEVNRDWCVHFGAAVNNYFPNKDSYHRYLVFLLAKTLFDSLSEVCVRRQRTHDVSDEVFAR
ncbi:MAG: hypothetical protein NUV49_03825 [Patescibacteria group bacterium]|nr:hypothetical protein [Patescibacteria group bacterium]